MRLFAVSSRSAQDAPLIVFIGDFAVEDPREPTAVMPKPNFSAGASSDIALQEGVLEVPGPWLLRHGGELSSARIAWRLTGPSEAPLVCAMG
jgi:hypothetical protein